ncbi:hypothetical protein Bhyg_01450 [Pseudolycoriella hygida]|uniref:Uncharacterized protein n=1 Tax=Pseudolycoriella hygida TaxID=35572 RepID=A0A9Q0S5U2_9DIPT|nr:hypothetical protein Bhyg_01450 [Pseudolycoriella hygida]
MKYNSAEYCEFTCPLKQTSLHQSAGSLKSIINNHQYRLLKKTFRTEPVFIYFESSDAPCTMYINCRPSNQYNLLSQSLPCVLITLKEMIVTQHETLCCVLNSDQIIIFIEANELIPALILLYMIFSIVIIASKSLRACLMNVKKCIYMSSSEGADACPIHDGFLQALLHLQNTCGFVTIPHQPNKRCTCSLHRILIKETFERNVLDSKKLPHYRYN